MFPVLFQIYGYEFYSYPIMIILGVFLSAMYLVYLCSKNKLMLSFFNDYLFLIAIITGLCGRIGGILEFLSSYQANWVNIFNVLDGNYNYHGAFLGMIFSVAILCLIKKEKFWTWLDILAQSFLVFMLLVFFADFLSGKNYGTPSNLDWAVRFDIPEVRYTIPVHPVQIYAMLIVIIIFLFIQFIKRKKQYQGVIASYIFLLFFISQMVLHFFKGAPERLINNISISLVLNGIFASIFLIFLVFRKYPNIHFLHQHDH